MKWALLVLALSVTVAVWLTMPLAADWRDAFQPATLKLLLGQSPYGSDFFGPPWALFPLIPLAVLPTEIGRAMLFLISLALFGLAAIHLKASRLALSAFLISPPVIMSLWNGNLDAMAIAGVMLPPWLGLFVVSIKPQIGIAVATFWMIETFHNRTFIRTFAPFTATCLLSLIPFGLWPLYALKATSFTWNASLWPMSIPIGIVLLASSIRLRSARISLAASPCLSPYLAFQSWSAALIALAPHRFGMVLVSLGLWAYILWYSVS